MSYTSLLIDTCSIRRFVPGLVDAYGNPIKAWANLLVTEPCRWSTPSNREVKVGAEVVLADLILFVEGSVDITEQDRVILDSGVTFEILSVIDRQASIAGSHHKECLLRTVR